MPLKAEVEEELKKITDTGKRDQARALYEEFPHLQAAFMAERDYHRKIQEVAAQRKDLESKTTEVETLKKKNLEWWQKSEKEYNSMASDKTALEAKVAELEAGRAAGAGEGTPQGDQIAAKYQAQIDRLQKEISDSKASTIDRKTFEDEFSKRFDGGANFVMELVAAKEKHLKEFGEPLGHKDLLGFMETNKLQTIDEAYDRMTQEKRQALWEVGKTAEITARVDADLRAKYAQQSMPTAEGGIAVGPLKQFISKESAGKEVADDGSGKLASMAAQELRSEGKF